MAAIFGWHYKARRQPIKQTLVRHCKHKLERQDVARTLYWVLNMIGCKRTSGAASEERSNKLIFLQSRTLIPILRFE